MRILQRTRLEAPSAPGLRLPALTGAVLLLLLNDHVLKAGFDTWWTGKLSDFAGLFAFALFWGMLFPRRRRVIALGTGLAFIFWKSPASGPLIAAWNQAVPWEVGRVVDWTDWIALVVLPFAARLAAGRPWPLRRVRDLSLAGLSLFAFAATTPPVDMKVVHYGEEYPMDAPRHRVMEGIVGLGGQLILTPHDTSGSMTFDWEDCPLGPWALRAEMGLDAVDSVSSLILLRSIEHECGEDVDALHLKSVFEEEVVAPLSSLLVADTTTPPSDG